MEQRQDYVETQMGMLSKVLRKLLEKLLGIKSDDLDENEMNSILSTEIASEKLRLNDIKTIPDNKLIEILVNDYNYDNQNIKLLADVLYDMSKKGFTNDFGSARKALILYNHYIFHAKGNIDFIAFTRKNELEK